MTTWTCCWQKLSVKICGGLKVIVCKRDTRSIVVFCVSRIVGIKMEWSVRKYLIPDAKNAHYFSVVKSEDIILPTIGFHWIWRRDIALKKERIFVGPQIREILIDSNFKSLLEQLQLTAFSETIKLYQYCVQNAFDFFPQIYACRWVMSATSIGG